MSERERGREQSVSPSWKIFYVVSLRLFSFPRDAIEITHHLPGATQAALDVALFFLSFLFFFISVCSLRYAPYKQPLADQTCFSTGRKHHPRTRLYSDILSYAGVTESRSVIQSSRVGRPYDSAVEVSIISRCFSPAFFYFRPPDRGCRARTAALIFERDDGRSYQSSSYPPKINSVSNLRNAAKSSASTIVILPGEFNLPARVRRILRASEVIFVHIHT